MDRVAKSWGPRALPTHEEWLSNPRRAELSEYKRGRADEQLTIMRNAQGWLERGAIDRAGYEAVMGACLFDSRELTEAQRADMVAALRDRYPEMFTHA